jgi:hypothetical protein
MYDEIIAMTKPKVFDMTKYSSGVMSLNDQFLVLLLYSLQNAGWAKSECEDENLALQKALKGKKSATMLWHYHSLNAKIYYPMGIIESGDRVVMASARGHSYLNNMLVDIQLAIVWDESATSQACTLYANVTPATV